MDVKYNINDPNWKGFLLENGFVVLSNIVDNADEYLDRMWDDITELSGGKVDRRIPSTRAKASNYPYMMHGGMIQYMGHSQLQWDIRERTASVFANLYDVSVDQLSTSFDGLCFMDGMRGYRARSDIDFLHADQSPTKNYLYSIQGLLNLTDSGPSDGGFVCVPGSHTYRDFFDGKECSRDDWYLFTDAEKQSDPMFEMSIKVNARAGDFILWDSRLWHCNTVPKTQAIRSCVYVCMLPKRVVSETIRAKRRIAVTALRTSSHHPGNGFHLFPKKPQWCGDDVYQRAIAIQQRTVLTPLQKILAE